MKRNYARTSLIAAGVAILGGAFALSGGVAKASVSAPSVIPFSASGCERFLFDTECTSVVGSGLKITSISGYFDAADLPYNGLHIEIFGPKGLIKNCPQYNQTTEIGPTCSWTNPSPNTNEPAGNYCTEAWQNQGSNGYSGISTLCIDVHS
jgi:hypothetical protein